jgi:hypothetical protein
MMKQILHEIRLRKDCQCLIDKYGCSYTGMADYLGLNETILRRFLKGETACLRPWNYKAMCKLDQLAKDLKEAEAYKSKYEN